MQQQQNNQRIRAFYLGKSPPAVLNTQQQKTKDIEKMSPKTTEASTQTQLNNDHMDLIIEFLILNRASLRKFVENSNQSNEASDDSDTNNKQENKEDKPEVSKSKVNINKPRVRPSSESRLTSGQRNHCLKERMNANSRYMDELKNVLKNRPMAQPITINKK